MCPVSCKPRGTPYIPPGPETKPAPSGPVALPAESEPKRVLVTTELPSDGVVVEATWTRQGNVINVRDLEGRLYTQPFGPNDDPEHVARKLLREKHGRHGSFYNRINYPPASYH